MLVYAVNDGAVMLAWAKNQKVGLSMVKLMGDPKGDLTKALDLEMTHEGPQSKGLYGRCKRHAMFIDHGVIKAINVSEAPDDPAGDADPSNTLAEAMIAAIKAAK